MSSLMRTLGAVVARRPGRVVIATVLITVVLGSFISQQRELDNSSAAFSPDNAQVTALNAVQERFGDEETLTVQILVTSASTGSSTDQPVLTAEGVRTVLAVEQVVRDELGDALVKPSATRPPPILSFAQPVLQAADQQGLDPQALSDAEVLSTYARALENVPAEQAARLEQLLGHGGPDGATTGIMLVTLDASAYPDDGGNVELVQAADQLEFAAAVRERVDSDYGIIPFSFLILQNDTDSFQSEIGRLFGIAVVVVLLVLAAVLRARRGPTLGLGAATRRTIADVALTIGTVFFAIVWEMGIGVLLGPDYLGAIGAPSPPSQIVPILLIALGVDYAIHLNARYRDELGFGAVPTEAARTAISTVGVALLLGALTTAIGFLTNLTSPIPPIADLGILAAVGLTSAFVLTTTFLPAVRLLLDRRAARRGRLATGEVASQDANLLPKLAVGAGTPALRHPYVVLGVGFAITVGAGAATSALETEFELSAFIPEGTPLQEAFTLLDEEFGGGLAEQTHILITGDAVLDPATHNAQVEALDQLANQDGVVTRAGRPVAQSIPSTIADARAASDLGNAPPELAQALEAAEAAGLRPDLTVPPDADLRAVYEPLLAAPGGLSSVLDLGPEPASRITVNTQAIRVGVDELRTSFQTAAEPITDTGAEVTVTSELIVNTEAITSLQTSQIRGLLSALLAVLIVLTIVFGLRFRMWIFGSLLLLPVAAVAVWTLGLMALTGIPFDPVTATISALVIGVGIDFSIHLGERFVEDLHVEHDPVLALRASLRHTGAAMAGSALTTMLGFAVLITGSLVPFQRLGSVTLYAVGLSLFASLAVQPAVLLVWAQRGNAARLERASEHDYPDQPGSQKPTGTEDEPAATVRS